MIKEVINKVKDKVLPSRPALREELNTPKMHDLSQQRDARCVPLAFELIKLIAEQEQMPVGAHVKEKMGEKDYYLPTIRAFMRRLIEEEVKITEITYIFVLARQGLEMIESAINETMNRNMNKVTELVYGLPDNDYDQVTIKQLNDVVMRKHLLSDAWKPVLEADVDTSNLKEEERV